MYAIITPLALAKMIQNNIRLNGVNLHLLINPVKDEGAIKIIPGDEVLFRMMEDQISFNEKLPKEYLTI